MKNITKEVLGGLFCVVVLIGLVLVFSTGAAAQAGDNAVYNSSGNCNSQSQCAASPAFFDASVFVGSVTSPTVCSVLNYVLNTSNHILTSTGAVIDARGVILAGASPTCTSAYPSPWSGISSPPPSTILLPAGVITIPSTWVLPSNTHLIGEGDNTSAAINTTLRVSSGTFTAPGPIIQFGPAAGASGISLEKLTLDGQGMSVNGIVNEYAGDDSYVDHVSLYQIRGTGLLVEGSAANSGPYSNILFDTTSNYPGTSSTVCAQIYDVSGGTRGIHGLTCHAYTNDPPAAVLLDSSNNTIADVTIIGFYDGIRVGANGMAKNNVLMNIAGDTVPTGIGSPINTIHIENGSTYAISDLSIMGTSKGSSSTYTVEDDLTSTHLADTYVAMYAIGNKGSGGYYSRFTTTPNAASWVVGAGAPTGSCAQGSLYSCIGSSNGCGSTYYALWACAYNGGTLGWQGVE
jgi:hypothetical protein